MFFIQLSQVSDSGSSLSSCHYCMPCLFIFVQEVSGSNVPNILHQMSTKETPPTYFMTNKFTKVFQSIVHSYGIASYQEVNPGQNNQYKHTVKYQCEKRDIQNKGKIFTEN